MYSSACLVLILTKFSSFVYGQSGINPSAGAISIAFTNDASVGPDGPWWYIQQAVDTPDQLVALLPSLSNTTLIVNASACSSQSAQCPLPTPTMWSWSDADEGSGDNRTISDEHIPSVWDPSQAALLRMGGKGQFFSQRMTIHPGGDSATSDVLDYLAMAVSNSYYASFPGGAKYTLDSGFFSLYGGTQIFSWPDVNNYVWYNNRTIPGVYYSGYIPSTSYGLHVGSVNLNVTGSLVLGGYDSSRCLTEPIISDSQSVSLTSISLNVSSGGFAYGNATSLPIEGLLQADGSSISSLDVYPDPGVPYLYLPRDTCDAIAAHLPVTYNEDFNLYFWDTADPAYQQIISSPHYLAFTFSGGSESTSSSTINVPFALLNLTLESPLMSNPTSYFPCSPWVPAGAPYTLGRSFLQAAFLAQNWNTSTLFLAQAPGPDYLPPSVKTIAVSDTTLSPATNPPDWESTWSSTLQALPLSSSDTDSSGSSGASSGLSGGAIAGIVIGVVVLVAFVAGLAFWLVQKRRRRGAAKTQRLPGQDQHYNSLGTASTPPHYHDGFPNSQVEKPVVSGSHAPLAEAAANQAPVEAPAVADPAELDARSPAYELDTRSPARPVK